MDELLVGAAHEHGMAVHVWTINDEPEMARLLDLGVDGMISDLPTPLVALVAARGLATSTLSPGGSGPLEREAQPRPQLGRLPWFAFFLLRILRLTVRLDIAAHVIGSTPDASSRGRGANLAREHVEARAGDVPSASR